MAIGTRNRTRIGVVAIGVGCGVLMAAVLSQLGFGSSRKAQIASGSVAVLNRAARASDALPASLLSYPFAERNFANANGAGARLVKSDGSLKLYAVPGKARMLCLVELDEAAQTAGGACADRSVLLTGSIYMADREETGLWQVAGLVGDGLTFAEANGKRTRVENNVFLLRDVAGGELTLGSPTAEQRLDFGD
jgi:hypothetical protein